MLWLPVNKVGTWVMLVILVFGGILAAAPAWGQSLLLGRTALVEVPMVGVVVAGLAFGGLCRLVRCRHCRYRLFWHAVARRSHEDGIAWFLTARQCPQCHATA